MIPKTVGDGAELDGRSQAVLSMRGLQGTHLLASCCCLLSTVLFGTALVGEDHG